MPSASFQTFAPTYFCPCADRPLSFDKAVLDLFCNDMTKHTRTRSRKTNVDLSNRLDTETEAQNEWSQEMIEQWNKKISQHFDISRSKPDKCIQGRACFPSCYHSEKCPCNPKDLLYSLSPNPQIFLRAKMQDQHHERYLTLSGRFRFPRPTRSLRNLCYVATMQGKHRPPEDSPHMELH